MQRSMYAEWVSKNEKLESPKTRKARRAEYWYILELAGIILFWKPLGLNIANVLYLIFIFVIGPYYLVCFVMSMKLADSLSIMSQYLNFSGLILVSLCFLGTFQWRERAIIGCLTISADGFYDYGDTLISTNEIDVWKSDFLKVKKLILVVVPVYFCLIAVSLMLSPTMDLMFSRETLSNQSIINGIYQGTPVKMWYYHSIDSEIVRWITILSQILVSGSTALGIGSTVVLVFFCGQHLIIQLKILNMACRDMDKRADLLYEKATGKKPPTEGSDRSKNQELMGYYKFCLKQVIEHHHIILQYASNYQSLVNWPGGVTVIVGSIVVAMSMLSIMEGGGLPSILFTSFLLVIAEVASIYMLCEVGEMTRNQCEELYNSMYSFKWMDCSTDVQKIVIIMKCGMTKPFTLIAGSMTPVDRNTFSSVMNTAYSYMNLMLASGSTNKD